MHQYCSSYIYKDFVNQSQSETTLQCTNSSSEFKAPQPSKSYDHVPPEKSFKPNTWQYNLVELIEGTKGLTDKVKVVIKRFVTDFLEKRTSKQELSATVPLTNDVHSKKRARSITPIVYEELSSEPPFDSDEHTKKRARQATPVITEELRTALSSTSGGHSKKRARPTTPIIYKELSTGLPLASDIHANKRARPITPVIKVEESLKKHKLDTTSSGLSPIPMVESIQQTKICKPYVTESQKDENTHYNERELKENDTSPTRYDTPTAIQTSSRPCLNVSPDADDDDDELDNEVATILTNGVPPTVGGYRPMPPTIDGYRPISEYYVPRLIQDREIKELEREPILIGHDGGYHHCGPTLRFTREPNKDAIMVPDSLSCLYRNKKFGEVEKVGSIQTENSSSFWCRPSC